MFAWTTPNHYAPWLSFHGELSMAAAFIVGGGWLYRRTWREPLVVPWLAAVALLASAVPAMQWLGGVIHYGGDAWLAVLYLVAFALAIVLGDRATRAFGIGSAVAPLQGALLAGALVSVWLAWYQWFGHDYLAFMAIDLGQGGRPYANLIQPNNLATLLVMGLLATTFLLDRRMLGRATAAALVVLLGLTIAATQSRIGLLEVAFVGATLAATARPDERNGLRRTDVVVGALLVLAMPVVWQWIAASAESGLSRGLEEMASAGMRPVHWMTLLDAIGRHPWLGWGWGQVSEAQFVVAVDHPATRETLGYAHNLVLDLLLWNGVPIGLALTGALALWVWTGMRRSASTAARIVWCGAIAVLLHALVEFPFYYLYFTLPVGFFMGAVSASGGGTTGGRLGWRVPRALGAVVFIAASALTIAIGAEYLRFEEDVRRLRFFQNRVGTRAAPQQPNMFFLTQLEAFWNFAISSHRRGMTDAELRAMESLVLRFPSEGNMVRYAASLALNGSPAAASDVLRRVCRLNGDPGCSSMRGLWQGLGTLEPEIAAVPWPDS